MLSLEVKSSDFKKVLKRLQKEYGITAGGVYRAAVQLMNKDSFYYTPPISGGGMTARKAGERAVERDIGKLFWRPDSEDAIYVLNPKGHAGEVMVKASKDKDAKVKFFDKSMDMWNADASQLDSYHRPRRNARGRIPGKWNKMLVRKQQFYEYVQKVKQDVGKTRAGWLNALWHYASVAARDNEIDVTMPKDTAWVERHGANAGSWSEHWSDENIEGVFTGDNGVPWIQSTYVATQSTRILNHAVTQLKKILEKRVQQLYDKYRDAA